MTYSAVRHLAHAIFLKHDPRRLFITMFTAYFDESGSHPESKVMCLTGLVASERKWEELGQKWQRILRRYKVECFHASEYANGYGEFFGWDQNKRDSFYAQLIGITKTTIAIGFSLSVTLKDWETVMLPLISQSYEKRRALYLFLLYDCWDYLSKNIILPQGSRIACIFDQNQLMEALVKREFELAELKEFYGPIGFGSRKEIIPLQSADMVAYEAYKEAIRMLVENSTRLPRKSLKNLWQCKKLVFMWHPRESLIKRRDELLATDALLTRLRSPDKL